MIVSFTQQGGDESETLPADGAIVDVVGGRIIFIDQAGDTAVVDFDMKCPVIIQDEGGDEGEQVAS